jgi:hypothetical protein
VLALRTTAELLAGEEAERLYRLAALVTDQINTCFGLPATVTTEGAITIAHSMFRTTTTTAACGHFLVDSTLLRW